MDAGRFSISAQALTSLPGDVRRTPIFADADPTHGWNLERSR